MGRGDFEWVGEEVKWIPDPNGKLRVDDFFGVCPFDAPVIFAGNSLKVEVDKKLKEMIMEEPKVLFTKEITDFIQNNSNMIQTEEGVQLFFPVVYKKTNEDNVFIPISLPDLSEEVKTAIISMLNIEKL